MSYLRIPQENLAIAQLGCGPECSCANCRALSGRGYINGIGEHYIQEPEQVTADSVPPGRMSGYWGLSGLGDDITAINPRTQQQCRASEHRIRRIIQPASTEMVRVSSQYLAYPKANIQLHGAAYDAYRRLKQAAEAEGIPANLLKIISGYRSVARQQQLWTDALQRYGSPQAARRWVAPPGGSPHHTGRAIDLWLGTKNSSTNIPGLRATAAYRWLVCNAARFGFTPYAAEPWHWEYNPQGAEDALTQPHRASTTTPPLEKPASGSVFKPIQDVIEDFVRRGLATFAMGRGLLGAISEGVREVNELTNRVFFALHPERKGVKLASEDPQFRQLSEQWLAIRDRLVMPVLRAVTEHTAPLPSQATTLPTPLAAIAQYRALAEAAAVKYGVDSALILGVIAAESGGNKELVARSGYTGLMQAGKGAVHKSPEISIDAGTKKLRDFRAIMEGVLQARGQRYGELPAAEQLRLLALAYNAGPVTVAKALQYAAEAGTPQRWLDAEHYKRALLFTGAYSLKQAAPSCLKGLSPAEQESGMREAVRVWNHWRLGTKKANWRKLVDPPPWRIVSASLPSLVVCAIDFKHGNSPKYAAKILAYRDQFRSR